MQMPSLAYTIQQPEALRNTLLVAGIHYAWNTGELRTFEPTFLTHKIETIRLVNASLAGSRMDTLKAYIKPILTLCYAEVIRDTLR